MKKAKEILAESFCKLIQDHFHQLDDAIEEKLGKLALDKKEADLYQFLEQYQANKGELVQQWENTPLSELDGKTPGQIIQDMDNLNDIIELFSYMAKHTDEEIPDVMVRKLKAFGQEAVSRIEEFAVSRVQNTDNADYEFVAAVSMLGEIGLKECVDVLIRLAYMVQEYAPLLDHVEQALKNIGPGVVEPIMEQLNDMQFGKAEMMMLYVLAHAGSEAKDERIYQKLRSAFRKMDDKMPAILNLSVYGDGRAVTMLRGYLQKNAGNIQKNVFYEILGAIRNLGGNTEEFIKRP